LHKHHSALGLATALRPVQPVTLLRPHAAKRAARFFAEKFPGKSLYAVKANPSPELLKVLWDAGVTHYDVASLGEVRLVAETLPEAVQCFMHPVKAEEAIAEAYFDYGVRTFSLDTLEELEKILRATNDATDLNLLVRLRVSSDHSKLSLASKFGAEPHEVKPLLMAARQASDALGLCFHVGSQAMSPAAYADAMVRVRASIVDAAVTDIPQAISREIECGTLLGATDVKHQTVRVGQRKILDADGAAINADDLAADERPRIGDQEGHRVGDVFFRYPLG